MKNDFGRRLIAGNGFSELYLKAMHLHTPDQQYQSAGYAGHDTLIKHGSEPAGRVPNNWHAKQASSFHVSHNMKMAVEYTMILPATRS